jgi:hypothetical protein
VVSLKPWLLYSQRRSPCSFDSWLQRHSASLDKQGTESLCVCRSSTSITRTLARSEELCLQTARHATCRLCYTSTESVTSRSVRTAAQYQRAGLPVHREVAQFHRAFRLYGQPANRGTSNLSRHKKEAYLQSSLF